MGRERIEKMPTLSQFYGIIIKIYFQEAEHNPSHFHAFYGGYEAEFSVASGKILEGELPPRIAKLVQEWHLIHHKELEQIWST